MKMEFANVVKVILELLVKQNYVLKIVTEKDSVNKEFVSVILVTLVSIVL